MNRNRNRTELGLTVFQLSQVSFVLDWERNVCVVSIYLCTVLRLYALYLFVTIIFYDRVQGLTMHLLHFRVVLLFDMLSIVQFVTCTLCRKSPRTNDNNNRREKQNRVFIYILIRQRMQFRIFVRVFPLRGQLTSRWILQYSTIVVASLFNR